MIWLDGYVYCSKNLNHEMDFFIHRYEPKNIPLNNKLDRLRDSIKQEIDEYYQIKDKK